MFRLLQLRSVNKQVAKLPLYRVTIANMSIKLI